MISSYIFLVFLLFINFNDSFQQCNQLPGVYLNGNDLPNGQYFVNSIDECCLRCQVSQSCQAFSVLLSAGRYLCYLKYAIGSNRISNSLATSGVKKQSVPGTFVPPILPTSISTLAPTLTSTSSSPLTTTRSTTISTVTSTIASTTRQSVCNPTIDSNYPGNDIPGQGYGNVPTYLDCCNLCGANPACTAFSYSVNDKYCWLKNPDISSGGYNGQLDYYPTYISGAIVARK